MTVKLSRRNVRLFVNQSAIPMGSLQQALADKDDRGLLFWLLDEVPEGGTLNELLVAIAQDSYTEHLERTRKDTNETQRQDQRTQSQ